MQVVTDRLTSSEPKENENDDDDDDDDDDDYTLLTNRT